MSHSTAGSHAVPRCLGVVLLALVAWGVDAQNPDDLSFSLRLTKEPPQYAVNETITFEVSLASSAEHKYYASWRSLAPLSEMVINLEPRTGFVDVHTVEEPTIAMSTPIPSGYLTSTPVMETGDLTQWFRFERAGHFRFSLTLEWVSRVKITETGGREQVSLQSNSVEFDILAPDPGREAAELAQVLEDIDHGENLQMQAEALHRLELMQIPAAAQEEVRRYLAGAPTDYDPYYSILAKSSGLDEIIPSLEAALINPSLDLPPSIVDLLATLQVRKQMGDPSPSTGDPAEQEKLHNGSLERNKLEKKLFAQYSKAFFNSIRLRSGPERLNAEFEAWSNAERQYERTEPPPELLTDLRAQLLSSAKELSPEQQSQFLVAEWYKMPHRDLLPLVQRVAMAVSPGGWSRDWAFKFWCEDWPADCTKALFAEARKPDTNLREDVFLLIPQGEHPELDTLLEAKLSDAKPPAPGGSGSITAALILSAGSRNIERSVDTFLSKELTEGSFRNGNVDGYLLGYLFRVSPGEATKQLRSALENPAPEYYPGWVLMSLARAGAAAQPAVPLVINALNSLNLSTAASAARFLAVHGSDSARAALFQRLDTLRAQWGNRAAEIRSAVVSDDLQWRVVQLEDSLVSALTDGKSWRLRPEEQQSVIAGCLTEQCRQIVEGHAGLTPITR